MKINTAKIRVNPVMTKATLIFMCALMAIALPLQLTKKASADIYDDQISALQQEIKIAQDQANQMAAQADTYQNAINTLQNQMNIIQAQINISQAQYNQLISQIADTETSIKNNQDAMGKTIADIYVDDSITPLEMLASSKSIGDYLDKQEYRASIRNQLTETIARIKELKAQLEKQKIDVKTVLDAQTNQKASLITKKADQQALLASVNSNEAAYQAMISKNQSQIEALKATQALMQARYSNSGGYVLVNSGSLGDYPWNGSNCPMVWYFSSGGVGYPYNGYPPYSGQDGKGYGCRQCSSYVAWRLAKETGYYPTDWGDAVSFTNKAKLSPWSGVEGAPQAGSVAVMDPGTAGNAFGHVAWVEAVDGDKVLISQYNFDYGAGYGMYSEMWLSVGAFDHYIHIN